MAEERSYGVFRMPLRIRKRAVDHTGGEHWLSFLRASRKDPPFLNHGKKSWVPGGAYETPAERLFVVETFDWWDPSQYEVWHVDRSFLTLEEARAYCQMIRDREKLDEMRDANERTQSTNHRPSVQP